MILKMHLETVVCVRLLNIPEKSLTGILTMMKSYMFTSECYFTFTDFGKIIHRM